MNKQIVFMLWLMFLLLSFCSAELEPIERWAVQAYWDELEIRMTGQQALEILGSPSETEELNSSQIWYYSEMPQRQGQTITHRPENGYLVFKQSPAEPTSCLLVRWQVPDWNSTTPYTERDYLTRLKLIEAQKAKERAILQRQALSEQREQQTEKRRAELQAARQKKIEEAQQRRTESIHRQQSQQTQVNKERANHTIGNPEKEKPLTAAQKSSKFLIYGGIFIFIMAVIISALQGAKYLEKR